MKEEEPLNDEAMRLSAEGLGIVLRTNAEEWMRELAESVNHLLVNDFNKLIAILYRMDIPEAQLRARLDDSPDTDAAVLIAQMIVERQVRKIRSRKEFRKNNADGIDEAERW